MKLSLSEVTSRGGSRLCVCAVVFLDECRCHLGERVRWFLSPLASEVNRCLMWWLVTWPCNTDRLSAHVRDIDFYFIHGVFSQLNCLLCFLTLFFSTTEALLHFKRQVTHAKHKQQHPLIQWGDRECLVLYTPSSYNWSDNVHGVSMLPRL